MVKFDKDVIPKLFQDGYAAGWNAALDWAAENAEGYIRQTTDYSEGEVIIDKQSILNGKVK